MFFGQLSSYRGICYFRAAPIIIKKNCSQHDPNCIYIIIFENLNISNISLVKTNNKKYSTFTISKNPGTL